MVKHLQEYQVMKRLHVHVSVESLEASVRFYSRLFAAEPTVLKHDYAKWMLEDPRLNFAISVRGTTAGIEHLGIQVENEDELAEVYERLRRADRPVFEEGKTVCCYAKSEKSWIEDPQGVKWETFLTTGGSTVYGQQPAASGATSTCCIPAISNPAEAEGSCCTPAEKAAAMDRKAACCG